MKEKYIVKFEFSTGKSATLCLESKYAPKTVEHFVSLIEKGVLNGTIFHRVIEDFMIQGGGYKIEENSLVEVEGVESVVGEFNSNGFSYSVKTARHCLGLTNNIYLKPNTAYKLSLFRTDNNVNNYPRTYIYNINNDGTYILNKEKGTTGRLELEFTTVETGIIALGLGVGNDSNGATGTIENIMISETTYNYVPSGRWLKVKNIGKNKFNYSNIDN
jgi:cyclophilin family peptidyl-prolyl cis-trans isomerase